MSISEELLRMLRICLQQKLMAFTVKIYFMSLYSFFSVAILDSLYIKQTNTIGLARPSSFEHVAQLYVNTSESIHVKRLQPDADASHTPR